jgi:predicted PurR-regulated permease PerM
MGGFMGDEDSRLARIENKLDNLIDQFHKLENTDTRQEMKIEHLENKVEAHDKTLNRYFERLEILETKPARNALQAWVKIGSIILSVVVTAIVTFFLVYIGVKK